MRLIDADKLLTERKKSKYYHLPNGDIAIPIIDIEHAPTIEVSEDAISRADAIKAIVAAHGSDSIAEIQRIYDANPYSSTTEIEEMLLNIFYAIQDAPSVRPQLHIDNPRGYTLKTDSACDNFKSVKRR